MTISVTTSSPSQPPSEISRPSPKTSIVIVDCGSGYSRVANYHISPETNLIHAITTPSHIPALHTVIHCTTDSAKWIQQLIEIVKHVDSEATQVLIGATGGVRDLISLGKITWKEVEAFRKLLADTELSFEATLDVLSGEDEAEYEFISAEYCARKCGFAKPEGVESIGLMSSGGMSSQLFVKGVSHSLETEIKRGNRLGEEHGMEKGKTLYRQHVAEAVNSKVPVNYGGEKVLYLAIEMLAAVGEKAGMGGIVVPVGEAIERLSSFIQKKTEEDAMLGEECDRNWKTYVHVMSGIVGLAILRRLHSDSNILFLRLFELGEDHILKPSWSLGRAIQKFIEVEV